MPRKTHKSPAYRQRPGYTQALVTLTDSASGKRRDYWLGEYGSAASREAYHRLIAEWEAAGRRWPERATEAPAMAGTAAITVTEVVRAYWRHASRYYRPNESGTLRVALRLLRSFYGRTPAAEFGPKKLRLLRDAMIRGDPTATPPRRAWTRGYANHQTRRIRQAFRWAAAQEMIPASVHQSLEALESLKRGRCSAREGRTVTPVPKEMLDAVLPHLNRQVRALVELQLLTGARPGELLGLRAVDLDTSNPEVWAYRPTEHKTAYRGRERVIYLGPGAQRVLGPFMSGRPVGAYLFSPLEADAERRAERHANRKTPLSCGNRPGTNVKAEPECTRGERYTTNSYCIAVRAACDKAFPPPERLRPRVLENGRTESREKFEARLTPKEREELREWRRTHRWHPHQLRHNAATEFRKQYGLEAAQLILGHSSAHVTDAVYAERDAARVIEVARKIG